MFPLSRPKARDTTFHRQNALYMDSDELFPTATTEKIHTHTYTFETLAGTVRRTQCTSPTRPSGNAPPPSRPSYTTSTTTTHNRGPRMGRRTKRRWATWGHTQDSTHAFRTSKHLISIVSSFQVQALSLPQQQAVQIRSLRGTVRLYCRRRRCAGPGVGSQSRGGTAATARRRRSSRSGCNTTAAPAGMNTVDIICSAGQSSCSPRSPHVLAAAARWRVAVSRRHL